MKPKFSPSNKLKNKISTSYVVFGLSIFLLLFILSFLYLNLNNVEKATAADTDPFWTYNFGSTTGTYNTASSSSTSFLPTPSTGGGTARVRIGNGGGSFVLANPGSSVGSLTELQGKASSNATPNKFSVSDYTGGKSFYTQFSVRFSAGSNGSWYFYQGDGAAYTDENIIGNNNATQVFSSLICTYSASNGLYVGYKDGNNWITLGGAAVAAGIAQDINYKIQIYGNNTTSAISYYYPGSCTPYTVEPFTYDVWVSGIRAGVNLPKGLLPNNSNIDSWMVYGINSASNATIQMDDIVYSNTMPTTSSNPTSLTFPTVTSSSISGSFTKVSSVPTPDGYIVLARAGQSVTDVPTDFINYSVGSTIGNSTVLAVGSSNTFTHSNLIAGTQYYYSVFSYLGTSSCKKYITSSPLTGSQYTYYNQATSKFRSKQSGTWSTADNWEYEYLSGQYQTATVAPSSTNSSIIIRTGHSITSTALSLNHLEIQTGSTLSMTGNLTVNNGSNTIDLQNDGSLSISGSLSVAGAFSNGASSSVTFNSSGSQSIPSGTYQSINISNGGTKTLSGNITVNGTLTLSNGIVATSTNKLTLGSTATISGENANNYIQGVVETTRAVSSTIQSFGGLGATLDAQANSQNLGNVTVKRTTGSSVISNGNYSIKRIWDIEPTTQPTGNVNLTLSWLSVDDENAFNLTAMQVYKSQDNGSTWKSVGTPQNTPSRSITVATNSFSIWTLSDASNPMPIKLTDFTIEENNSDAIITWAAQTEINNKEFHVEKSLNGKVFTKIGVVSGSGNSTSEIRYSYTDNEFVSNAYFRIKQIDFNGNYEYSNVIHVKKTSSSVKKEGYTIFPNPLNERSKLVSTSSESGNALLSISIYSLKGVSILKMTGTLSDINNALSNVIAKMESSSFYLVEIQSDGKIAKIKVFKP